MSNEFKWYAGTDGENYPIGPHDSRDALIAEAMKQDFGLRQGPEGHWDALRFFIIEAEQTPVQLSKHFCVETMLDRVLEGAEVQNGFEDPILNAWTDLQQEELDLAIQTLIDMWQARHGITITPPQFTASRNRELYQTRVPLPAA